MEPRKMKTIAISAKPGRMFLAVALISLGACAADANKPQVAPAATAGGNDFPTLTRVEYVLECMQEHGGENYDNLYHCVCSVDHIAGKMSHEDYAQAQTFSHLFNLPGERGGEFRDPPQSEKLRKQLKEAKLEAAEMCFPKTAKSKGSKG